MSTSLSLVFFLMGIFFVQNVRFAPAAAEDQPNQDLNQNENTKDSKIEQSTDAKQQEDEESDDDEDESNEDERKEPSFPLLTCLLFENDSACNTMCSLIGSIYGISIVSGTCDKENQCECDVSTISLEDLWNKKFNNENILQDILKDKNLSKKIFKVLQTPFRTSEQTVQDLKPFLSADQLESLHMKTTSVPKLFTADGKFDQLAIKKYVAKELKSKQNAASEGHNYKDVLINKLNTSDEKNFSYIANEIRQSRNKHLNKILDTYLSEHNIPKPLFESNNHETLIDILDTAIINRLIKPAPRKTSDRKDSTSKLSLSRSKPTKSSTPNPDTNPNIESIRPSTIPDPPVELQPTNDDSRWVLKGFNKKEVDRVQNGKKCWETSDYTICFSKNSTKKWLYWDNTKKDTLVEFEISNDGEIEQSWLFDRHTVITIHRRADGTLGQIWTFKYSGLNYYRNAEGKILREKWRGPEDPQSVEKYKRFINTWCEYNDFYVGKENCIIY